MKFIAQFNLYRIYDRAYEDCLANLKVEVPDNWMDACPEEYDDIHLLDIWIDKNTEDYLVGTFHTNIPELVNNIRKDLSPDLIYECVTDEMASQLEKLGIDPDSKDWWS